MDLEGAKKASLPTGLADKDALSKGKVTIEKGPGIGGFLQTSSAAVLRRLALSADSSISDVDRDLLASFLSEGEGYAPQSGQIVGILKQMPDRMEKDMAEAKAAEEEAIKVYEAL